MASTAEFKVKKQVKEILAMYGAYVYMPVSNGMGAPALDLIVCLNGFYLSIETKAPGGAATPRQRRTMGLIEAAGGKAIVIDGSDLSLAVLIEWLAKHKKGTTNENY